MSQVHSLTRLAVENCRVSGPGPYAPNFVENPHSLTW